MKALVLILALTQIMALAFAGGGVDVGNSRGGGVSKGFTKAKINFPVFDEEREVAEHLNKVMNDLLLGKDRELERQIQAGNCSLKDIKFKDMEAVTVYTYDASSGRLLPKITGQVSILLKDCLTPDGVR